MTNKQVQISDLTPKILVFKFIEPKVLGPFRYKRYQITSECWLTQIKTYFDAQIYHLYNLEWIWTTALLLS